MPGLVTAATGVISKPLDDLRTLLSNCTGMQTWMGVASSALALAKIHIAGLPPTDNDSYTKEELDDFRPFVIVSTESEAGNSFRFTASGGAGGRHFNRSGQCRVYLEQAVAIEYRDDPSELDRLFQNAMGEIIEDTGAGSGLLDLTATGTYFGVNSLVSHGPFRATEDEIVADGDHIWSLWEITWGQS